MLRWALALTVWVTLAGFRAEGGALAFDRGPDALDSALRGPGYDEA